MSNIIDLEDQFGKFEIAAEDFLSGALRWARQSADVANLAACIADGEATPRLTITFNPTAITFEAVFKDGPVLFFENAQRANQEQLFLIDMDTFATEQRIFSEHKRMIEAAEAETGETGLTIQDAMRHFCPPTERRQP